MSDREVTRPNAGMADYFKKYGEAATQRNIVGDLLKFNKFGEWVHGQYDDALPRGTRLAVHMQTLTIGWQKWQANRPADAVMGLVCDGFEPPRRNTLGDMDKAQWEKDGDDGKAKDPWQFSNLLVLSD